MQLFEELIRIQNEEVSMDDILARWSGSLPEGRFLSKWAREEADWSDRFHDMDKYDWSDPAWKKMNEGSLGIMPIPLTQGYFMIVSRRDYRRMTAYPDGRPKRWRAKIDRHKETGEVEAVYALRSGRGDEPPTVYAHRELCGCLYAPGCRVDHVNGWCLDNRLGDCEKEQGQEGNLKPGPASANGANRIHSGPMTGVVALEREGPGGKKRIIYIGQRCRRIRRGKRKGKVVTVRTKRFWLTPEPAHRWYENQLKKIHGGRRAWVFNPVTVSYPHFPPRMDSEPTVPVARSAMHTKTERERAEIPF